MVFCSSSAHGRFARKSVSSVWRPESPKGAVVVLSISANLFLYRRHGSCVESFPEFVCGVHGTLYTNGYQIPLVHKGAFQFLGLCSSPIQVRVADGRKFSGI